MTTNAARTAADGSASDHLDRLQTARDHAHAMLLRLDAEYVETLGDPDALQEDRDNARTLLESARRTFSTAQAALDHASSELYGQCVRCGGPIGAERLEALPDATRCVGCEARS